MAERRMFAKTIIDSDVFLDMPLSTQALYFHLSMRADDDGFINNPKKIMRMIGASQNELEILLAKKFIICFENGVVVIKHWLIHNYIRTDRYKATNYKTEKALLRLKDNKSYTLDTDGIPLVDRLDTQVRLGKDRLGKDSIGKSNKTKPTKKLYLDFVKLTEVEYSKLVNRFGEELTKDYIERLNNYIGSKGKRYKSHYYTILAWDRNRKKENNCGKYTGNNQKGNEKQKSQHGASGSTKENECNTTDAAERALERYGEGIDTSDLEDIPF